MKKLLIVDNSIVIINVLKDLFTENNRFEVCIAKRFEDVPKLIEENEFFLAISNTVLPDALNGELVELLDENGVPTIILSSKVDHDSDILKNKNNIIDYILKDSLHGLGNLHKLVELLEFIKGMKVLVVDDSAVQAQKIKDILESLFLKVVIAGDGVEALEVVKKHRDISLVITDYNMPEINGLDLIKLLRKDTEFIDTPIIIMSAIADNNLKINLYKNGASDFIVKPILEEELKAKLIDIFSHSKHLSEVKAFDKIFNENIISSSTDSEGLILSVSDAFCKISGYSREELIGKNHNLIKHPDMPASIYEELWATITEGKVWKGEIKNKRKDGTSYWVSAIIEPKFDRENNIIGYYAIRQDISDKKRIYELSITDGLTSLYNRRYFNEIADELMHKSARNSRVFSFLILDIDNFKKYNDTYGHQKGDDVLISVSAALTNTFKRSNDFVFRLGGEEFGVLINTQSEADAVKLAEDARAAIQDLGIEHEKNLPSGVVTASFGMIILSLDCEEDLNIEEIYQRADECLYQAKDGGRNRIVHLEL